MILNERLQKIQDYLAEKQTATLSQLAELNSVSFDTVRRDLERLEKVKFLRRVRGGAILSTADIAVSDQDPAESEKKSAKQKIASRLGSYVSDGQSIALSGGTTCAEVASFLVENYYRLTVLTNNIKALEIFAQAGTFTVLIPGGVVDADTDEIFGEQCEKDILQYNIDVAIVGSLAVSLEKGLTAERFYQKGIMNSMLRAAQTKILVADSSKFGKSGYINICPLEDLDVVISDLGLPETTICGLKKLGLQVVT